MDKNRTHDLACSIPEEALSPIILVASAKFRANSTQLKRVDTNIWETNLLSLSFQRFINIFSHLAETLLYFRYWSFPAQFTFGYSILFVIAIQIVPAFQQLPFYVLFVIYIWLLNAFLYGTKPLHKRMTKE